MLAAVLAALAFAAYASPDAGKALFDAHGCAACHKVGVKGGDSGPDLSFVGFRRSREWLDRWLGSPRAWKHDALMPDFKLDAPERGALVEFLSSLQGHESPPWKSLPDAEKGKVIYAKAGCVACHGAAGRGGHPNNNVPGEAIPALSKTAGTYTPEELIKKIANGVKPEKADPKGPEPLAQMPKWSEKLTPEEISAVAFYVLTLAETPKEDF